MTAKPWDKRQSTFQEATAVTGKISKTNKFGPQTSFSNNVLKKVRFLKSQILSIINMPYLLEAPYGRKIYSFSMICLPHKV